MNSMSRSSAPARNAMAWPSAGGDGGIGGFAVELPGSAGRQHDRPGPDQGETAPTIPDQAHPGTALRESRDRS